MNLSAHHTLPGPPDNLASFLPNVMVRYSRGGCAARCGKVPQELTAPGDLRCVEAAGSGGKP
jgi:hypothetical protein